MKTALEKTTPLTAAAVFCAFLCFLNASGRRANATEPNHIETASTETADIETASAKIANAEGKLSPAKTPGWLSWKIPTSESSRDMLWWHRVLSVQPPVEVVLSADTSQLELPVSKNLPRTVEVKISSQQVPSSDARLRMNQIQLIGTHNSYHIAPHPGVLRIIRRFKPTEARYIAYTHPPLSDQLTRLSMRQFEFDVFNDKQGGTFAYPRGARLVKIRNWRAAHPEFDRDAMATPGFKVLEYPDFDFRSNTPTVKGALGELSRWSREHSLHLPIMILIETEKSAAGKPTNEMSLFNTTDFDELEKEILQVLDRDQIITPDEVRGSYHALNEAIRKQGWPRMGDCRGRFLFALDNLDEERVNYLKLHPQLRGGLLFVSSPVTEPEAAFLKMNDPVKDHTEIRQRVEQGYLVRTRADADLVEGRANDLQRSHHAFSSGAQYVSTDFPEARPEFSDYVVRWENGQVGRLNPLFNHDRERVVLEPAAVNSESVVKSYILKVPSDLAR
jgi:hypothetical protein